MRLAPVADLRRPMVAVLTCVVFTLLLSGGAVAGTYSALVADIDSERVLYERNADELRHPASLTKMMTLYLVFEALAEGRLFTDTLFRTSRFAVLKAPSKLGLLPGDTLSVEQGILGLVTRSANDAATVIAEGVAGSEPAFAAMMTDKARQLGMSRTVFRNASGLPDPNQVTTAWDMFRLGKALNKNFPRYYSYFSTPNFVYEGHNFTNHNHLMERYPGMDGIKTGFINASGFNLVASAQRNGHRLVGVVFGGPSARRRDALMQEILDDGFAQLDGAPPATHWVEFDRPAVAPGLLARAGAEAEPVAVPRLAGTRAPRVPHPAHARPVHLPVVRHAAHPRLPAPAIKLAAAPRHPAKPTAAPGKPPKPYLAQTSASACRKHAKCVAAR